MARSLFEPFLLFHLRAFSEAVSLAHLVEAEIVSPYSGILINTGVGNPTEPLTTAQGRISRGGRRREWKGRILIPLYGRPKLRAPTGLIKLAYLPSAAVNGAVGLPTPVLMRIPE